MIWISLWLLVPGIYLLWQMVVGFIDMRLLNEGIVTTATITDLQVRSEDDTRSYHVSYQFQASVKGNATLVQGHDQISQTLFERLEQGQPIEIVYWSVNPSFSAVRAELQPVPSRLIWLAGSIGGALILLVLGILLIVFGMLSDWRSLKRRGIPARGVVFRKWSHTDSDGDTNYYVSYAFTANIPGKGNRLIARTELNNKELYDSVTEGDELMVLYLPSRPRICQGFPLERAVSGTG
ncbi:MAG: DUF3592 domain-containing protein [Chloroflexaceae bacterium]